jgi:hypothetical protein
MYYEIHEIFGFNGDSNMLSIVYPEFCPICHTRVRPTFVYGHFDDSKKHDFSVLFSCSCGSIFMSKYTFDGYGDYPKYRMSIPDGFEKEKFNERINTLSPNFVEVYNQSLEAEELGLNNICGAGYRKSIEYLVKDYCSLIHPEDKAAIWNENLGSSINRIDEPRMRALSFAAKEIGNDQTHTVIKLSEGIPEMKEYILALVAYVDFIGASNIAINNYPRGK